MIKCCIKNKHFDIFHIALYCFKIALTIIKRSEFCFISCEMFRSLKYEHFQIHLKGFETLKMIWILVFYLYKCVVTLYENFESLRVLGELFATEMFSTEFLQLCLKMLV